MRVKVITKEEACKKIALVLADLVSESTDMIIATEELTKFFSFNIVLEEAYKQKSVSGSGVYRG